MLQLSSLSTVSSSSQCQMMASDLRHVVGNHVEAKACHVTSSAKCTQRYGSNKNTKMVSGIVMAMDVVTNAQTTIWQCLLLMDMTLVVQQSRLLTARLNVQSVKAVVTETGTTATTAQGTVLGASIGDSTAEPSSTINGTVPELTAAPSDDTTTTESTETTATPAEQPPTTPMQQHYHAASPQPTAVTHQQKWLEDNAATRLPVKGYYSHHN